jgi:acetolactate decarboxylase
MKTLLALALLLNLSPFDQPKMVQYSTIDAFLAGVYNGDLTVGELKKQADFGIGTFNGIDGELFMLDGEVTQIRAVGNPLPATDDMLIPFATFCTFAPGKTATLAGPADDKAVVKMIEQRMFPNTNVFYAVKLEGTFTEVVARAPRKMDSADEAISKVLDTQSVFTFPQIEGTMVGFWCPQFVNGLNVGGWHMHFLSKDKTRGGHVLSYGIGQINVSVMEMMNFEVMLPHESAFFEANLNLDRAEIRTNIEKAEGGANSQQDKVSAPKNQHPGSPALQ